MTVPMQKSIRFFMMMFPAFLARVKPVSTMAKPHCMKNTRIAPTRNHTAILNRITSKKAAAKALRVKARRLCRLNMWVIIRKTAGEVKASGHTDFSAGKRQKSYGFLQNSAESSIICFRYGSAYVLAMAAAILP